MKNAETRSLVPNHHNGSDFPRSGGKGECDVDDAMKAGDRPSVASMLTGPGRGRPPRDATLPFQLTQRQTPRHAEGTHVPLLSSSSFHGDDEYGSLATRILSPRLRTSATSGSSLSAFHPDTSFARNGILSRQRPQTEL
ncbi:hypothetical protein B0H11DRAFT_2225031 [Mycena galericulata]|nr:hypothetical protein B0H11DRAFT_2225031 [Mycena galericulata]